MSPLPWPTKHHLGDRPPRFPRAGTGHGMNRGAGGRSDGPGRPPSIIRSVTGLLTRTARPPGPVAPAPWANAHQERGVPVASYGGIRWTSADVPIARLWGELDVANASEVFAAIRKAVGPTEVIVDFSEVTFIDSSGLAQLVALAGTATVRVVAPRGCHPRRVLELTGLIGALSSFDTVEAALEAS
jgi:anti-sigma B factor antagonist